MSHIDSKISDFLAQVPSTGDPMEIPIHLLEVATPVDSLTADGIDADVEPNLTDVINIMALGDFQEQWGIMHDMIGGIVSMRTQAPCPLGEQARSVGGLTAARSAYELISKSPALSRLILSPESTFFGQLSAIGIHGFICVQIVKASVPDQSILNSDIKNEE